LLNQKNKEFNKKKTAKKGFRIILICMLLLGLTALSYKLYTDYSILNSISEPRTINNLRKFINDNENNWLIFLTKNELENKLKEDSLKWQTVLSSPSIESVNSYIQNYGITGGSYLNDANMALDSLYWAYILSTNDVDTIQSYINKFPYGKHINEANQLLSSTIRPSDLITIKSLFQSYYQALSNANIELAISHHDVITNRYENASMITHEELQDILGNLIENHSNFNMDMSTFNASKKDDGNYHVEFYLETTFSGSDEQIDPISNNVVINEGPLTSSRKKILVILNENLKIIDYFSTY